MTIWRPGPSGERYYRRIGAVEHQAVERVILVASLVGILAIALGWI